MAASDLTIQRNQILKQLKSLGNPDAAEGMARYGINTDHAYGVSIPNLRKIARKIRQEPSASGSALVFMHS